MTNIKFGVSMELLIVIPLCIIALIIVVGGYVYMFLHVMRCDPRELEFRENLDQDNRLVPHTYK
ncbi:MAG: hypothetical protein OQK45_07245 [Sulfurovum sp.]|nr:hypothetical protein [Sulfurovum sp.]